MVGPSSLDAVAVFPDHIAARITAIAALAAVIRRDRTGQAVHVHISQAEVAVSLLDNTDVTEEALAAGLRSRRHGDTRRVCVRG